MFASDPIKWADFSKWNLRRLSQNSSGLDGIITNSGATIYLGSNTNLPSWFLNSTNNNVFTASTSPAHTVIITSNSTLLNEYHSASNAAHNQLTFQGSPINMDKFIDISKAIPDSSVPGGQLAYNDTTLNRNHIIAYCRQLLKNEIDEKQRELGDSYVVLSSGLKSNDPIEILNATLITDTITVANDNTVTAHANATSADPASGQITIKDDHNNAVTGWTFSGWSTKSGNTYSDITSRDLATDLNDSNLDSHGLHDINDVYAKITLADGSVIHTPAMKIQVLGGVGQANTYMHTTTAPQASVGVKNYTAVHNEFSGATYSWVENTGTDSAPTWTDFNDFNTRTQDREGNLAANDKVYVKIAWGDGTYQYVKAPVTIKNATDEIAALTGLKGKALTVHVVNDGTMPAYLDDNTEFTYTDRAGNPQTKKLSEINSAAALAWSTAAGAAVPNFKLASGQADYDAVITVRGESTSVKVKIPVTIIGASAKTTIPTIDSMHSLTEAETKNDLDLPSGYSFDATDPNKKITASWIYATANRDGSFTTHALDNTHQIDTKWSSTHTAAAAWIKVQFGNDASHCQIVHVSIPLRSSNAGINTALAAADTAIATHVGAPATNWTDSTGSTPATLGNARDYVHLTYGTGASATAVDLSNIGAAACPIASITWAAKPDTSAAADASANKKATIKITFTDGSRAKTVEVPYTVIGAKAKSDLETNHGTALTASDEISNFERFNHC